MDEQYNRHHVRTNTEWKTYFAEMNVPRESLGLCIGVNMFAKGTVWFDDVKVEVIGDHP
jgi:hypothetical protein